MSVCTLIAADCPLESHEPEKEYGVHFDIDTGVIDDGDTDDNFYLHPFSNIGHYSEKAYGVALEWFKYTEGRGEQVIAYIRRCLEQVEAVELCHVWLSDYDPPKIHRQRISIDELRPADIHKLDEEIIWADPASNQPTWHYLIITR